jgi:hypothetical protein
MRRSNGCRIRCAIRTTRQRAHGVVAFFFERQCAARPQAHGESQCWAGAQPFPPYLPGIGRSRDYPCHFDRRELAASWLDIRYVTLQSPPLVMTLEVFEATTRICLSRHDSPGLPFAVPDTGTTTCWFACNGAVTARAPAGSMFPRYSPQAAGSRDTKCLRKVESRDWTRRTCTQTFFEQ